MTGLGEQPAPGPGNIVWLSSYHKSGNTWLRLLFTAYGGKAPEADINHIQGDIAASRAMLDQLLGISTGDLMAAELDEIRPLAYRAWSAMPGGPHVLKNHEACGRTRSGTLVFPPEATRCVIHIVRDPRDVVVSASHHWALGIDATIERLNNPGQYVADEQPTRQIAQWLSDWSGHARSWIESGLPRVTLRYEDLLADAAGCFRTALQACGYTVDEARLCAAVDACQIDRLREQERAGGFRERPRQATAAFFREGKAGGWHSVLSAQQAQRITDHHGEMMARFGYV